MDGDWAYHGGLDTWTGNGHPVEAYTHGQELGIQWRAIRMDKKRTYNGGLCTWTGMGHAM
eukprot:12887103-Prorocentrum_lima.AAC.1